MAVVARNWPDIGIRHHHFFDSLRGESEYFIGGSGHCPSFTAAARARMPSATIWAPPTCPYMSTETRSDFSAALNLLAAISSASFAHASMMTLAAARASQIGRAHV